MITIKAKSLVFCLLVCIARKAMTPTIEDVRVTREWFKEIMALGRAAMIRTTESMDFSEEDLTCISTIEHALTKLEESMKD
jgi:hypothetical protein